MIRKNIVIIIFLLLTFLGNNNVLYARNKHNTNMRPILSNSSQHKYEVITVKYSDAKALSDNINRYLKFSPKEGTISVDETTNSIVIQGTGIFITSITSVIQKLDDPKHYYSFNLSSNEIDKAYEVLKNHFHIKSNSQEPGQVNEYDDSNILQDKSTTGGLTLKCSIEKTDTIARLAEPPSIQLDTKEQTISILGNRYQVESAKAIISSLSLKSEVKESNNQPSKDNEDNISLKKQLEDLKAKLDTSLSQLEQKDKQLASSEKNIGSLTLQLKKLQSENLWNILSNPGSKQTALKAENDQNKQEILSLKEIISDKDKIIASKEEELQTALNKLQEISSDTENNEAKSNDSILYNSDNNEKILISTLSELSDLKTELKKTKHQLNNSKYQLELIFGGKLLDSIVMPNDKSGWFK